MAWIESHQTLRDHPKIYALMDKLKISKPQAIGHLHLLWWWCVDYAQTGVFSLYSNAQIAQAAHYTGDAQKFIDALLETKFLDKDDKGVLSVHDWLDFCGNMMHKRITRMNEKRKQLTMADNGRQNLPTVPTVPYIPNHTNQQAFDVLWAKYPRKLGKDRAFKIFLDSVKSKPDFDRITRALENYCANIRKNGTEEKYIKHGSTWFNSWTDWEIYQPPKTESFVDVLDNKKAKWIAAGLSDCHGKKIVDGHCDYCLITQKVNPPKVEIKTV